MQKNKFIKKATSLCQNKNILYLVLSIVITYSIFLRIYKLWDDSFWIDEGFSSYSTISWKNLEYYIHNISQLLSFKVFWVSDWSARFPSLIFSTLTIPLIYFISQELFWDKRTSIIATLLFCFSTIEITWARQARFYTLLQFLFYLNIYFSLLLYQNPHWKTLLATLCILIISLFFHPFLFINLLILLWVLWYIYIQKITITKKQIWLYTLGIIVLLWVTYLLFWENVLWWLNTSSQTRDISSYIDFYSTHLLSQAGWLYIFFIISFFIFAYKQNYIKTLIFSVSFLSVFYVISQKWLLLHTRYVFFLFPLVYIWWTYAYIYIADCIKNIFFKIGYLWIIGLILLASSNISFLPQSHYELDFTAPQVDFKSAYNIIPEWSNIVSWFPMMCKWYFWSKWTCKYSLAVDYVGKNTDTKLIYKKWEDSYTGIPYLKTISLLKNDNDYYIVLDALSYKRMMNQKLKNKILESWEVYYNSGRWYKNIKIIRYNSNLWK